MTSSYDAPAVSVVTIFWNAERFLKEAISSVFAQTYQSWELLLVDDGSTDGGTELARSYEHRYPDRVRYLCHPEHANRGMSRSRNLGARYARGRYLAFLDADDVWRSAKLERQVALLEAEPFAGMVYGPTEWWYSWTNYWWDDTRDFVHELGIPSGTLLQPPTLLALLLENEGLSPCTCSVLIRREAFAAAGGFEERFRGMYEDQAFFAKLSLTSPILVSDECLCRYRQHPGSACAQAITMGNLSTMRSAFLEWLADYLTVLQVNDQQIWRTLRREQWNLRHPVLQRVFVQSRQLAQQARGL